VNGKKDWSLWQKRAVVLDAWWKSYGMEPPYPYVHEVFDKYLIVDIDSRYAKVKYDFNDGEVAFSEPETWKPVQVEYKSGLAVVRRTVLQPIKFSGGSELEYECYGILFGDEDHRDLEGTYFTKDTNFYLDWYNQRPWLYHHGMNKHVSLDAAGVWKTAEADDKGVFFTGELDSRHKYLEEIQTLLDEGNLYPSTGTFSYLMKVSKGGWISDWPVGELSSTVAPAEFRMDAISPRAAKALETLGGMP